jgi:hypothetical protein
VTSLLYHSSFSRNPGTYCANSCTAFVRCLQVCVLSELVSYRYHQMMIALLSFVVSLSLSPKNIFVCNIYRRGSWQEGHCWRMFLVLLLASLQVCCVHAIIMGSRVFFLIAGCTEVDHWMKQWMPLGGLTLPHEIGLKHLSQ